MGGLCFKEKEKKSEGEDSTKPAAHNQVQVH